jgi:hypothetical protein
MEPSVVTTNQYDVSMERRMVISIGLIRANARGKFDE